jgi:hypothetical protein
MKLLPLLRGFAITVVSLLHTVYPHWPRIPGVMPARQRATPLSRASPARVVEITCAAL